LLAPAALGGQSPTSLGSSFAQGMATGQPAGSGAQSLSAGTMNAIGSQSPPAQSPVLPAVAAPVANTAVGAVHDSVDASASSAASSSAAPASGGAVPVAPAV